MNFISLGNELKPEHIAGAGYDVVNFISLGNELKPEQFKTAEGTGGYFISLGNELKPEPKNRAVTSRVGFYIVRKRA